MVIYWITGAGEKGLKDATSQQVKDFLLNYIDKENSNGSKR